MAKKLKPKSISNRRARFDYNLGDSLTVGVELTGSEVKNLRMGHGQLRGAYVTVKDNELQLINATIAGTSGMPIAESDKTRPRRLLAKRREIDSLIAAKQQGRTIVPLEIYTTGRYIKIKIAIGTGKKHYDKRQSLKAKDEQRQINRTLKHR
ncbi:MAG TPA: SsrA-binding protein SmpB [Candidatus Saccharimonadales bacterium]|jgi:SsrA-binding protein